MPTPRKNETRRNFISRCIPIVIEDGTAKDNKQAFAVCNSMWKEAKKDDAMSNARKKRKEKGHEKGLEKLAKVREEARKVAEEPFADQETELISDEEVEIAIQEIVDGDKELADKFMVGEVPTPFGGAQSWDDLDEFLEAQATGEAVRQTEFEFRRMMNNILEDETLSLDQKSDKIAALANGFPERAATTAEEKKDIDPGFIDRTLAKIGVKAITKREAGANFVASDFADVPDRTKPSTWKLRLAEGRSGNFTVAQVARAITAMQPSGFRGQRVRIGTSKGAVARKISGAINKIKGATDEQKRNLRERLAKVKSTGFVVQKDLEGNFRWFGWVSNKWRDRDHKAHPKGEIIAEAAHKEFVKRTWKDPVNLMPQLWIWHTPASAVKARADWMDYADGFLLGSGPLTKEEGSLFEALAEKHDLAMSHGFFKIGYDEKEGIITKYHTFEVSVLPRSHVANEWTDFATLQEVKDMFTPEFRESLVEKLGEEKVAEYESSTKDKAEILKGLKIDFKEAEVAEEEASTESEEEETEEEEEGKAVINVDFDTDALVEKIGIPALSKYLEKQATTIEEQEKAIKVLTEKVNELTKSDDEKIAEKLTPRIADAPVWLRLSQSEETELKEGDELGDAKPKIDDKESGWIAEALGTPPTQDAIPTS